MYLNALMNPAPGTYALILQNYSNDRVQIGHWLRIDLEPGYYIYVGSAFGPGGVQARVLRHLRKTKTRHWHIDYLSEFVSPFGVWYSHESEHLEHRWAQALCNIKGISPVHGFGCSDCKCYSHLFQTLTVPDFTQFSNIVGGKVESGLFRLDGKHS
jgi:Uri superfamily endonuclease